MKLLFKLRERGGQSKHHQSLKKMDMCTKCGTYRGSQDGMCSQCWKGEFPDRWAEQERAREAIRQHRVRWEQRWAKAIADEELVALEALLREMGEDGNLKTHVPLLQSTIADSMEGALTSSAVFGASLLRLMGRHPPIARADAVVRAALRSGHVELLDVISEIGELASVLSNVDFISDCAYNRFCSEAMYLAMCESASLLPFIPWTSAKLLKNVKHLGARTNGGKSERSERVLKATLSARSRLLEYRKTSGEPLEKKNKKG